MNLQFHLPLYFGLIQFLPLALSALGIGASLYGANKQSKDIAGANAANAAAAAEGDRKAWLNYLLQRGLYADPNTATGVIPGMQPGAATNVKLPLYATLNLTRAQNPTQFSGPLVRRRTPSMPQ